MTRNKLLPATLSLVLAFMAGALTGGYPGRAAAAGQMLAAGAIALFYMLIGGLLAGLVVGILCWRWESGRIWRMAGVLLVLTGLLFLHTRYDISRKKALREERNQRMYREASSAADTLPVPTTVEQRKGDTIADVRGTPGDTQMGLGLARVPFGRDGLRLLFYPHPDPLAKPSDSLLFGTDGDQLAVRYAPPYLVPFYQKYDYQTLYFRLSGIHRDRAQIILNSGTGQRAWVDRNAVKVYFWPEFLVTVFAVYPLDPSVHPIRRRPLAHADPEGNIGPDDILLPRRVEGDWIYVHAWTEGDAEAGFGGWLRWRDGDRICVGWDYRM